MTTWPREPWSHGSEKQATRWLWGRPPVHLRHSGLSRYFTGHPGPLAVPDPTDKLLDRPRVSADLSAQAIRRPTSLVQQTKPWRVNGFPPIPQQPGFWLAVLA